MDFLDPKKDRRHRTQLLVGYCLVALAIGFATLVLLYQAFGYSVDRKGKVTQNGLLFVSSQPSGAAIYLNGQRYASNTASRVNVPADTYHLEISATGYRTWQRQVVVNGGDVQHFDYPFLFPATLQTDSLGTLSADPSAATQSPDRRWLVIGQADNPGSFIEYDFKTPAKPVATTLTLPDAAFTTGTGDQTWTPLEWAADNRHVLLQHTYTANDTTSQEYVLLDRDTPIDSVNLTTTLKLTAGQTISMYNNRVANFYVFDATAQTLKRIAASDGSTVNSLEHVLAFKPYSDNSVLYVTDQAPIGKATTGLVYAMLEQGQKTIALRSLPAGAASYVLNMAQYSGDTYVAVAAANDSGAYVYKNPQDETAGADGYVAAWRRLPVTNPNYLSFSSNTQFLLAENGQDFVVYDFENTEQYHYRASEPIDQPQTHASWMDGDRLLYVSNGKLQVFDYDYRNRQSLAAASPGYAPFFAPNFGYLYTIRGATGDAKAAVLTTPLTVRP